ncbi:hypothetical protein P152DRAFT_4666 [Eremomyces bilateralis CBS 781.70]|uniref:Uncharacterized protein n=1 Tax=Eremomyces bilateralis CBS 781.70 TaxID=1392243 RepID=A0A6G1GGB5_9PEZI|nr:uncharacterized protein P152DRAFT_4666 [Eremomyces bilateralis CBS 781.70]KAF1816951.1 hypothetical protein P152DRAFT_4666 [Eremomyces bilateralis CBS 781.70]
MAEPPQAIWDGVLGVFVYWMAEEGMFAAPDGTRYPKEPNERYEYSEEYRYWLRIRSNDEDEEESEEDEGEEEGSEMTPQAHGRVDSGTAERTLKLHQIPVLNMGLPLTSIPRNSSNLYRGTSDDLAYIQCLST